MPNVTTETAEDKRIRSREALALLAERLEEHVDKSLFAGFDNLLEYRTVEERIDAANRILPDDITGFAHLVLAVENDDVDKQKQHYEKALELSKKHLDDHTPISFVFGHGMVGLAKLLWSQQQREEAIRLLESADVDNLSVGQNLIDEIRYLLVTYLIVQNNDERARVILDGEAIPTFEWFYLNTLLRFRQLGDTFISRGALNRALGENEVIACLLTDTEYDTDDEELDWDRVDENYFELTRECWNETPDAISWLTKTITKGLPRVGSSKDIDQTRARRIDDEFELAMKHLEREDFKSAKRSFNSALREANRLNDGGSRFLLILELFTAFLEESNESKAPVLEVLKHRLTWLDSQAASAEPEALMNSYLDMAKALRDHAEDTRAAESCAQKAHEISNNIRSDVDSQTVDTILAIRGSIAATNKDFVALESHMRSAISLTEQTHGPAHLDIIEQLQFLRYALHQQNKHAEEIEIAKRVYAIDIHADKEKAFEELDWCEIDRSI